MSYGAVAVTLNRSDFTASVSKPFCKSIPLFELRKESRDLPDTKNDFACREPRLTTSVQKLAGFSRVSRSRRLNDSLLGRN